MLNRFSDLINYDYSSNFLVLIYYNTKLRP
jgi:hypothetical protein